MTKPLDTTTRESLRRATRYFYDLQKLRIQFGNRTANPEDYEEVLDKKTNKVKKKKKKQKKATKKAVNEALDALVSKLKHDVEEHDVVIDKDPVVLDEEDRLYLKRQGSVLEGLEADTLSRIKDVLETVPIYKEFLKGVKGCGPTMSGVIVSEVQMCRPIVRELLGDTGTWRSLNIIDENGKEWPYFETTITLKENRRSEEGGTKEVDITKEVTFFARDGEYFEDCCPTPSSLWTYAGLAVDPETGKAVRRTKGKKSNWNPFLKTKVVGVLSDCFIKARSPYRDHYDHYKHRKESEGWGSSQAHRHRAAIRVMMKQFLLDLWKKWRELEGLPVVKPYAEAMLDRKHGDHGGAPSIRKYAPEAQA